jgi:hypothetical protein
MLKKKLHDINDITNSYAEPIELDEGEFAIPKPDDAYMEGVKYDSIKSQIKIKQNDSSNSSGTDSSVGNNL